MNKSEVKIILSEIVTIKAFVFSKTVHSLQVRNSETFDGWERDWECARGQPKSVGIFLLWAPRLNVVWFLKAFTVCMCFRTYFFVVAPPSPSRSNVPFAPFFLSVSSFVWLQFGTDTLLFCVLYFVFISANAWFSTLQFDYFVWYILIDPTSFPFSFT